MPHTHDELAQSIAAASSWTLLEALDHRLDCLLDDGTLTGTEYCDLVNQLWARHREVSPRAPYVAT